MNIDELKQRFIEEVKLRAYDDKYIDKKEEKEILQEAIRLGVTVDSARSALLQVCEEVDYIIESELDAKAKEVLMQFALNDGYIDKKEFTDAVSIIMRAAKGRLNEMLCVKKAKEIVESNGWKAKEGMFKGGNWFTAI